MIYEHMFPLSYPHSALLYGIFRTGGTKNQFYFMAQIFTGSHKNNVFEY